MLPFLHLTDSTAETNPQIYVELSEAECVYVAGGEGRGDSWVAKNGLRDT